MRSPRSTAGSKASGLAVSAPQQNGRYVNVTGSVKNAQRAFGSNLSLYHRDGGTYQAPASTLTVPSDVSPFVLTVTGLDESPALLSPKATVGLMPSQYTSMVQRKVPAQVFPPGFRNAKPCSIYYGQLKANFEADFATPLPPFMGRTRPYAVCGYNPGQLRSAYGAPSGLTGKGVTVAIVDAYQSPTLASDANRYAANNGVQPFANNQLVSLKPTGGFTEPGRL